MRQSMDEEALSMVKVRDTWVSSAEYAKLLKKYRAFPLEGVEYMAIHGEKSLLEGCNDT